MHPRVLVVAPDHPEAEEKNPKVVVRALKRKGARVSYRTGLHIHVGIKDFTPAQVKNLVRIFYKQEELILKAAGTQAARIQRYTQKTDHAFVEKICRMTNPTMEKINAAWFGTYTADPYHYDPHRYRALNLNNLWGYSAKGTAEMRFFEATLHAGELRANILLALQIALKAKSAKAASAKNPRPYNEASAKNLLQGFDVRDLEDRRDRLGGGPAQAPVAHHLPLAAVGHRHHPVGKVASFVPRRPACDLGDRLRRRGLADPLVLELAPEGHRAHLLFRYRHLRFLSFCASRRPAPRFF